MKTIKFCIGFFLIGVSMNTLATTKDTIIYLFPGQGSDFRLFSKYDWGDRYEVVSMTYPIPDKNETLHEYALRFVDQIDTNKKFILIGVSLGGMICSELSDTLNPEKVIIISSAKSSKELPYRYTFQKTFPIYKIVPNQLMKIGALMLQPLVEPDRNNDKEVFQSMLKAKNPVYLKRTVAMIVNWDKAEYNPKIIHIHGDKDHTIPLKNVNPDTVIQHGSHMMTLTRSVEIEKLLESDLY